MPNWCNNRLSVSGPKADVLTFIEKAKSADSVLSFESLVPPKYDDPDYQDAKEAHVEGTTDHPTFNWYRWQKDHWGTKWDVNPDEVSLDTNESFDGNDLEAVYEFATAWCAPTEFYEAITAMFPTLTFDAYGWEPGCSVWFQYFGSDGESMESNSETIDQMEKLEDAVKEKLSELGFSTADGDLKELSENICDWYLDEGDLSEIPECVAIIETDDDEFSELAEEAGFKKN
jgi:hypothetical protein